MRISELEDHEQLVTKQYLDTKVAELEARLLNTLLQHERHYANLLFGAYGLIVASVFVNHFWR